jgi:dienelactone hydrolase
MQLRWIMAGALAGLLATATVIAGPIVLMPGPQDAEGEQSRRQLWLVPSPDPAVPMQTTVFRPPGAGPFPMVLMNHGATQSGVERTFFPLLEFESAALWFVRRGHVVVAPQRSGYGDTSGALFDDMGDCASPDFVASGMAIAESIQYAINYMTTNAFVRNDRIIVVGQSAAGFGTMALAAQNPPGVSAMINFSGGRGGHAYGKPNNNCAPDRLVETVAEFGRSARIPMLWIYTQNDSFFGPQLSRRMYEAFRAGGANVEYHLLPAFGAEGHYLIDSPEAVAIWSPIVAGFLAEHP